MRVFMSYSRRDSRFVSRLVDFLRENGHDVWLDSSDIRGSEEWRQSVVKAIRSADVVVLVISPRSMESADVQREVTLAAEEERRIVPVAFERAELTGGIQYELAGVHHISFVEMSFQDAATRLLEAIEPVGDSVAPRRSSTRVVRSANNPQRLARGLIALAVTTVAVAAVAAGAGLLTGVIAGPPGFAGDITFAGNANQLVQILQVSNGTLVDLDVNCFPIETDDACIGQPTKEGGLQMWLFTEDRCEATTIEDLDQESCPGAYVVDVEPNSAGTNAIINLGSIDSDDPEGVFEVRGLFSAVAYNRPIGGILPLGARLVPVPRN